MALAYRPRPGLPESGSTGLGMLITEFRGNQPFTFLQKTLGPGTTAERVTVNGGRGVWIAGSPHIVLYTDPQGASGTTRRAWPPTRCCGGRARCCCASRRTYPRRRLCGSPEPCDRDRCRAGMKTFAAALAALALALIPASASAKEGIELSTLPDFLSAGQPWNTEVHALPFPGEPPLPAEGVGIQIRDLGSGRTLRFPGERLPDGGYHVNVVFPSAGRWSYEVVGLGRVPEQNWAPVDIGPVASAPARSGSGFPYGWVAGGAAAICCAARVRRHSMPEPVEQGLVAAPALAHAHAEIEVHVAAEQRLDLLAAPRCRWRGSSGRRRRSGSPSATRSPPTAARADHQQAVVALLDLVDLHLGGVRQLLACAQQHLLADQLGQPHASRTGRCAPPAGR